MNSWWRFWRKWLRFFQLWWFLFIMTFNPLFENTSYFVFCAYNNDIKYYLNSIGIIIIRYYLLRQLLNDINTSSIICCFYIIRRQYSNWDRLTIHNQTNYKHDLICRLKINFVSENEENFSFWKWPIKTNAISVQNNWSYRIFKETISLLLHLAYL